MPDGETADRPNRLEMLVQATIDRHPDQVAVDAAGRLVTYRQFDTYADHIARLICSASPVIPSAIGLIGDRSVASYAAYLAILRLGATVVPMSPAVPDERIRSIARTAELRLILASKAPHPVTGNREVASLILPDLDALSAACTPTATATNGAAASAQALAQPLAYVLFTSGSTGRPKGVPISHDNALSFVTHNIARYALRPGYRMSQTFDISFDVSVYDMFAAWGSGATLVVPTPADLLHPVRWINERRVTHWASVPSVIAAARGLRELSPGSMPTLRLSLFIGEQLRLEQAEAWQHAATHGVIENVYGPTELTVAVSAHRLPPDMSHWPSTPNRTVPIGRIYEHLEWLIFDESGERSTRGELCVRGPQRFSGYIDPRDNYDRFFLVKDGHAVLADSATPIGVDHWYRTGDLVCQEPDGTLIHLGRLDDQVKIRGFRVELTEIENAMRMLPEINDAVVVVTPGNLGNQQLSAFYIGEQVDPEKIRHALRMKLPHYMIPLRIRFLDNFPFIASGKIDRRALADSIGT